MRRRTQSREFAIQLLYEIDITDNPYPEVLEDFWRIYQEEAVSAEIKSFTVDLVKGVIDNLILIDEKILQYALNWELKRMPVVDRNILRMGAYEILFRNDIPLKVAINEAVDLAKKYSDLDSGKFVNAILDKLKSEKETEK